jgi:hypothetical protein
MTSAARKVQCRRGVDLGTAAESTQRIAAKVVEYLTSVHENMAAICGERHETTIEVADLLEQARRLNDHIELATRRFT